MELGPVIQRELRVNTMDLPRERSSSLSERVHFSILSLRP
jgi:hypothetical protein